MFHVKHHCLDATVRTRSATLPAMRVSPDLTVMHEPTTYCREESTVQDPHIRGFHVNIHYAHP